jgi:RTA1 like protein
MLVYCDKGFLCFKPRSVGRFFVWTDVATLIIQCGSAGLLSSQDSGMQKIGKIVVLQGLLLQLILFSLFIALLFKIAFQRPRFELMETLATKRAFYAAAFIGTGCLLLRNVYRCLEYALAFGSDETPLFTNEWPLLAFDALPMLIMAITFTVFPLGLIIAPATKAIAARGPDEIVTFPAPVPSMSNAVAATMVTVSAPVSATGKERNDDTKLAFPSYGSATAYELPTK